MPIQVNFSKPEPMGAVHAELTLVNMFTGQSAPIRALVDTGATEMFVTRAVAVSLGFDLDEVRRSSVILADERRLSVPVIAPIEIRFQGRVICLEAYVLGEECLMGQMPLEGLDLIVDPKNQRLIGRHPQGPLHRA